MTKGEINLLYVEVEQLLSDICKFLNEEMTGGYISDNGRSLANKLIERSKKQLQTIAIVTTLDDNVNEPYVDMQSCKANQEQEPQEVYSDVSVFEGVSGSSTVDEEYIICPYGSHPAFEIKDGKTGHLFRKEKIFFFEQQKRIYAAIQQSWLLIYMNENSLKPCQTFDLTRYEAKPTSVLIKDMKKRDETFDLINISDFKSYHFTALTAKDMLQWVAAINRQSDKTITRRSLPPVPPNNTHDELLSTSVESSNDYEPLKEYQLKEDKGSEALQLVKHKKVPEKKPLPLPPRNTPLKEVRRLTPRIPSQESLSSNSSNYDSVGPGVNTHPPPPHLPHRQDNCSSFSEDDSDTFYDNPADIKNKEKSLSPPKRYSALHDKPNNGDSKQNLMNPYNDDHDGDEIYDYLQKPDSLIASKPTNSTNTKPLNTVQTKKETELGKSKPILKQKILSLRHRKRNNL